MNKTTFFLIASLLTTMHHHQTKTGMLTTAAGVIIIAAAAIYGYNKLQESQKSEVDKAVDTGASTLKDGLKKLQDKWQQKQ